MKTFDSIELFEPIHKALADENYVTPTPIQMQTIPPAVDGKDILGCAQTGTGKTAAFALPILDFIGVEQPKAQPKRPSSLILAPTRELAIQISDSFKVYGRHMRFKQALVYGGVSQKKQVESLRKGTDVLIATPGRLLDLMQQGFIELGNVQIFVLDEADRMLDMGFLPALKKIIAKLPRKRQSLFFSATLPPKSKELSKELLFEPVFVDVTPKSPSVKKIDEQTWLLDRDKKIPALKEILDGKGVERTIVFTRTKRGANQVTRKLENAGIRAAAIHGNKSQNARQRALEAFRNMQITVLVATDVAARGIDIDGVSHVINFDIPVEAESYVHRIGRTGRAGATGIAISFCTPDEHQELEAIERLVGKKFELETPYGKPSAPRNDKPKRGRGRSSGRGGSSYGKSKARRSRNDNSRGGSGNRTGDRSRSESSQSGGDSRGSYSQGYQAKRKSNGGGTSFTNKSRSKKSGGSGNTNGRRRSSR